MALLSACSSAPPDVNYAVTIDQGFTSEQTEAVLGGLNDWREALPQLHFDVQMGTCGAMGTSEVCIRPQEGMPQAGAEDMIGATAPDASGGAMVIIYMQRIEATGRDIPSLTQQTTAHEMGHAMGLQHSVTGELMAPSVPQQADHVTPDDVAQFWAVRGR
ncbi:MAG: matrixin family metalloprotease [Myxococcales bacterium]|nr:matrixin family metalloprotease [Myxococcales bacterium]